MLCLRNEQRSFCHFLRLHPSTAFRTLLLNVMATPFLLRDSCPIILKKKTKKNFHLFIVNKINCHCGILPGVTGKFVLGVKNEIGQRVKEFCKENALVIVNTLFQQHKRRLYTWTSPDAQHRNQIDYILCSQRWRISIQSAKKKKDQKVTVAQTMISLLPNSDLN